LEKDASERKKEGFKELSLLVLIVLLLGLANYFK